VTSAARKRRNSREKHPRIRDAGGNGESTSKAATRSSLKDAIKRFRALEKLLLSGDIDDRILRDLRAALNRVRNTAWGVQQYVGQKEVGQDPATLLTILAGERVRCAYSLCQAISSDLKRPEIDFQAGNLVELQDVVHTLGADVSAALKGNRV
jgi:hypothetical protein